MKRETEVLSSTDSYEFSCPPQAHWRLRAKSVCMPEGKYSCLYDVNLQVNVYRDKCIRPRILGPVVAVGIYILQRITISRMIRIEKAKQADVTLAKRFMHNSVNEKRYFVKLMIVGKDGAGKSSLLRRLLKEDTENVESTDGIDIVVRRCKINTETGEWAIYKNGVSDNKQERIQRVIDQALENKPKDTVTDSESPTPKSGPDEVQTRNEVETIISGTIDHSEPEPEPKPKPEPEPEPEPGTATVKTPYAELAEKRQISRLETISTFEDENIEKFEIIDEKDNDMKDTINDSTNNTTTTNTLKVNVSKHRSSSSLDMPSGLLSNVFASTPNSYNSLNHFASCGLWDFAGQKEFYATHQAFLTSRAIYVLVAEFMEDIRTDVEKKYFENMQHSGEYVDFWFDTIHCHQTDEKEGTLCPPVIIVFTGTDKCKENIDNRKEVLERQIDQVFGKLDKYKHLRNIFYLSNTTDTDDEFEKLRREISETATKMKTWGECVPLKWILLEYLMEVNMEKGKNFIDISDMREMAAHSEIGIKDSKDVSKFLCFQHEVGNIIYFEDIPDLIILNPQWLVDAFRCLVSNKFDPAVRGRSDWTDFLQNGLITKCLITKLFESKSGDKFLGKTNELLDIMLKFDILVETNENEKYVMPSMMPTESFEELYKSIEIDHPNCTRTSWFCLQFEFLPPAFFNHFSAEFMKKYKPTEAEGKSLALFRGICVFDVESESEKLLLTLSADRIAVQLLSFSKKQKNIGKMCSTIRKELISKIIDIEKRYKLTVSYEQHFKCSTGKYYENTKSYSDLKISTEYYCTDHKEEHKSDEIYMPWMMDEVKADRKRMMHKRQEYLVSVECIPKRNARKVEYFEDNEDIEKIETSVQVEIPHCDDCVVVFPCMPGEPAFCDASCPDEGGWMLRALYRTLDKYEVGSTVHILDILTDVNREISQCVLPLNTSNPELQILLLKEKVEQKLCEKNISKQIFRELNEIHTVLDELYKNTGPGTSDNVNKITFRTEKIVGPVKLKAQSCFYHNLGFEECDMTLQKTKIVK
ncbi:uncharacterized protein LOC134727830 [Mytilus trossulus]|uniref:uncharacterized protein LOC134727830 n=1 Tax=Mytilus trossulus TaxID=6551 RepID=UPI0030075D4E